MKIQVGDPSIDWLALPPQSDRKKVVIIEAGTPRVVGTTTEEIDLVEIEVRPALRRVQAIQSDALGYRRSETVVFREGFLPYSHLEVTERYTLSVAYRGTEIVGERQLTSGKRIPIRADVERPVFEAHSVEMVLRILPLTDGYVAELPVFHAGREVEILVTARTFGRETISTTEGSIDAWKVKTDWEGVVQYYWIGTERRELLRQFSELSEGVQLEFVRRAGKRSK